VRFETLHDQKQRKMIARKTGHDVNDTFSVYDEYI